MSEVKVQTTMATDNTTRPMTIRDALQGAAAKAFTGPRPKPHSGGTVADLVLRLRTEGRVYTHREAADLIERQDREIERLHGILLSAAMQSNPRLAMDVVLKGLETIRSPAVDHWMGRATNDGR